MIRTVWKHAWLLCHLSGHIKLNTTNNISPGQACSREPTEARETDQEEEDMADVNIKADEENKQTITLRVKDQTGEETLFKVGRCVRL